MAKSPAKAEAKAAKAAVKSEAKAAKSAAKAGTSAVKSVPKMSGPLGGVARTAPTGKPSGLGSLLSGPRRSTPTPPPPNRGVGGGLRGVIGTAPAMPGRSTSPVKPRGPIKPTPSAAGAGAKLMDMIGRAKAATPPAMKKGGKVAAKKKKYV